MKETHCFTAGMHPLHEVDPSQILDGELDWVEPIHLEHLAEHPLDCIETEYPHFVFEMDESTDHTPPTAMHPIFYGCFDWHSSVHSHWSLIRQCRLWPAHPQCESIVESITTRVNRTNAEKEATYLKKHPHFERPYGWGWYLRLVTELTLWEDDISHDWLEALSPLTDIVLELTEERFFSMDRPLRVGTHGNAAFGLGCVIDYAAIAGDSHLGEIARETALRWYREDTAYPLSYEPFGWDFLSPGLLEAEVMARVLDQPRFEDWFVKFLPDFENGVNQLRPIVVEPASGDGMAMHLIGLNLSRAWCAASLMDALDDPAMTESLERIATSHFKAGLAGAFTDDYAGSHWLTSYALYALTRNEDGIGPI